MKYSDESYNLRIVLDTKDCELAAAEISKMEQALDPLARLVKDFPVSDLYITIIHHPRSHDYHVKTSLVLTGRTLFTGDYDAVPYPAYERCVRKLVKKVEAYKHALAHGEEVSKQEKRTHQNVRPTLDPEDGSLEAAVEEGDYVSFRRAISVYEEPISLRAGRWVQRYPLLDSIVGERLMIGDVVEEVFLQAFEKLPTRSKAVPLGEWLEQLIDPSINALIRNPDEELENVNFARTLNETKET